MKAFKITDPKDDNRSRGFVVANDYMHAMHVLGDYCTQMEDDDLKFTELNEISREDFNNTSWVDESAEPGENGEYPTVQSNYDEEVLNVTEPYVIEFER